MRRFLALSLVACVTLAAQIPPPTSTPDKPFFIKKTWIIGGTGNWDYLTMDPKAERLYIAHGPEVQVVDVETGSLAGVVKGLREAHSIALDETGEFGFVSDGPAAEVKVFDRRTFEVVASIRTGPGPRAIALDADSNLLIAICPAALPSEPASATRRPNGRPAQRTPPKPPAGQEPPKSVISVIDIQSRTNLADILVAGRLNFAQSDGRGSIFIGVEDHNQIAVLDLGDLGSRLRRLPPRGNASQSTGAHPQQPDPSPPGAATPVVLDWSDRSHPAEANRLRYFSLGAGCREPRALALDSKDGRVFAACNNLKMAVLNANTGETLETLPIGPGPEAVGFDADRGLIFTANGGAQGSVTIIRRDGTDSYAVVQTLPTLQQARTLAVNSSTGQVYLVTVLQVAELGAPPKNGIGTLKTVPQDSSFQVLVVGN